MGFFGSRFSTHDDNDEDIKSGYVASNVRGHFHHLFKSRFRKEEPNSNDGSSAHVGTSKSAVYEFIIEDLLEEIEKLRSPEGHIFGKQHDLGSHLKNRHKHLADFIHGGDHEVIGKGKGLGLFQTKSGRSVEVSKIKDKVSGKKRVSILDHGRDEGPQATDDAKTSKEKLSKLVASKKAKVVGPLRSKVVSKSSSGDSVLSRLRDGSSTVSSSDPLPLAAAKAAIDNHTSIGSGTDMLGRIKIGGSTLEPAFLSDPDMIDLTKDGVTSQFPANADGSITSEGRTMALSDGFTTAEIDAGSFVNKNAVTSAAPVVTTTVSPVVTTTSETVALSAAPAAPTVSASTPTPTISGQPPTSS